ncbi:MAG: DUF402 domain-containing protein [Dehalococcoidia bacterium]
MADPQPGAELAVYATKYDGSFHRQQPGWFIERRGSLILLRHRAGIPIEMAVGAWAPTTNAIGYYWTDRWYNLFRVQSGEELHLGYYCNIAMPARFDGGAIRYIDLDIDILVRSGGSYEILDEDEFEGNVVRYGYPDDLVRQARQAVREVTGLIQGRASPFDL